MKPNSKSNKLTAEEIGYAPWLKLALGIVHNAEQQAQSGDADAIFWLLEPDALDLVEIVGKDSRLERKRALEWKERELQNGARRILADVMRLRQADNHGESQCVSLF